MSFEALDQSAKRLKTALHESTGRHLLAEVSLETPGHNRGEVAFIKSVLWTYALWFEACQPTGNYIMSIVRNSSPDDHKAASRAFQDVQNLRTFHAHNLLTSNKSDQHKLSQAKTWIAQNGGSERNWDLCTTALCVSVGAALDILCAHWTRVTSSPEDAGTAIQSLINVFDKKWEPHLFDSIIEEAASAIGLSDFNSVSYRKTRLQEWQNIVGFFSDRSSVEAALRRLIHQEIAIKFGAVPTVIPP